MKIIYCFTLITFGLMTTSFSQQQTKTFIFVHAQWHGAWCWNNVVPLLVNKGYQTRVFDLPGHGADTSTVENVTLQDCVKKVVSEANAQPGQVILVGHSSAGVVIAQASEMLGKEKVASLVFLDAFLPNNGESVFSLAGKYAQSGSPLGLSLIVSNDQKTVSLNMEKVEELLYDDCSPEDVSYAKKHLRRGPIAVLATPTNLSEENYGNIPKFYIRCIQAKDMEKSRLAENVPCKKIYTLDSSHSPFFSMPDKLVSVLEDIHK
jgi:pimeloyl-ACP methyl ester carboxylesterase